MLITLIITEIILMLIMTIFMIIRNSENTIIKVQTSKQVGFKFLLVLKRTKLFFHLR